MCGRVRFEPVVLLSGMKNTFEEGGFDSILGALPLQTVEQAQGTNSLGEGGLLFLNQSVIDIVKPLNCRIIDGKMLVGRGRIGNSLSLTNL